MIAAVLAFMGQDDITVYFTAMVIAHLIITLLYVRFNPRARRALNAVGVVLFAGFLGIVALKVMEILSP